MADDAPLALAEGFEVPDLDAWRARVREVLEGRPLEGLTHVTDDGVEIAPLYVDSDVDPGLPGVGPFVRGRQPQPWRPWSVRQRITHPDASAGNAQIRTDLAGGVDELVLAAHLTTDEDTLRRLLDGVDLAEVGIVLDAGPAWRHAVGALVALWQDAGVPGRGALRADPLGGLAASGRLEGTSERAFDELADLVRAASGHGGITALAVDGRPVHDAGGSEAQELAFALGSGVEVLRALDARGLDPSEVARAIEATLVADADQFLTMAKLRAARRVWARVTELAGVDEDARGLRIHAQTSWRMLSRCDPWVNMLRDTTACFAAAVAGADAITVLPFETPIGEPAELGRRVARNTQLILREESHLRRSGDPGGGAWYLEELTDQLADATWRELQALEGAGGVLAALTGGWLHGRVAATRQDRRRRIAHRADPLTGVSEFPDLDEREVDTAAAAVADAALRVGDELAEPLPRHRLAEPFEHLRDAAAAAGEPEVFLATLGATAEYTARASFAANLFAAGGLRSIQPDGSTDAQAVADAFRASDARVACICSSDARYAELGTEVAGALRGAGAVQVLLAGRPTDELRDAGVDGFIHLGCDVLGVLQQLHAHLGLSAEPQR